MRAAVVVVAGLVVLTLLVFFGLERFTPGDELIRLPSCDGDLAPWTVSPGATAVRCEEGVLALASSGDGSKVRLRRVVDEIAGLTHLRLDVSMELRAGDTAGTARVSTFQSDGKRARWDLPHPDLYVRAGDGPSSQSVVLRVDAESRAVVIVCAPPREGGDLLIRDLSLSSIAERAAFRRLRSVLAATWLITGVWLAAAWLRAPHGRLAWRLAATGLLVLTLAGTLAPGPASKRATSWLAETAQSARAAVSGQREASRPAGSETDASTAARPRSGTEEKARTAAKAAGQEYALDPELLSLADIVIKKLGHAVLFALIGWTARRGHGPARALRPLALLIGVAAVVELMQLFSVDRTPHAADALINIGGSLCGWLLGGVVPRDPGR